MARSLKLLAAILVLGVAIAIARPGALPPEADSLQIAASPTTSAQPCLVGVGGCSASSCHGAAIDSPHAWQSSFTVWATQDPHAKAYSILFGSAAAQIVTNLAGGDNSAWPAYQDSRCLGCHSLQSEGPHDYLADGVGCEACHGAASQWVGPHTIKGWQPAEGMVDTKNIGARARKCVECHVGAEPRGDGATRDVNHDLIAAGHPRLAFELYAYLSAMPRHWAEKPTEDPLDVWALGKLVALESALALSKYREDAARQSFDQRGGPPWPEFAEYNCYSCHRPMQSKLIPQALPTIGTLRPSTWYSSLTDLSCVVLSSKQQSKIESQVAVRHASPLVAQQQIHSLLNGYQDDKRATDKPRYELLVNQIIERTDAANWDQVAQAYHGLQAIAKSRYEANPPTELSQELVELRTLLEFPLVRNPNTRAPLLTDFGKPAHFDSPRYFSPERAAELLKKIGDTLK